MKKCIVTLVSTPAESVEVPANFPVPRGDTGGSRSIERSAFGALRFFPGIPKTISQDEHAFIDRHRPEIGARLEHREYVESKRVDKRGATEEQVEKLASEAGISHLGFAAKCARLEQLGKLKRPARKGRKPKASKKAEGKKSARPRPSKPSER